MTGEIIGLLILSAIAAGLLAIVFAATTAVDDDDTPETRSREAGQ